MRGAGGTAGGVGSFFLGLGMTIGGGYMLLNSIRVGTHFGWGTYLYRFGDGVGVTGGMVLIPFLFGIGLLFYDARLKSGWLLTVGSLVALIFGVLSSLQFRLRNMSAFDLLVIIVLTFGGLGLIFRSLKNTERRTSDSSRIDAE